MKWITALWSTRRIGDIAAPIWKPSKLFIRTVSLNGNDCRKTLSALVADNAPRFSDEAMNCAAVTVLSLIRTNWPPGAEVRERDDLSSNCHVAPYSGLSMIVPARTRYAACTAFRNPATLPRSVTACFDSWPAAPSMSLAALPIASMACATASMLLATSGVAASALPRGQHWRCCRLSIRIRWRAASARASSPRGPRPGWTCRGGSSGPLARGRPWPAQRDLHRHGRAVGASRGPVKAGAAVTDGCEFLLGACSRRLGHAARELRIAL